MSEDQDSKKDLYVQPKSKDDRIYKVIVIGDPSIGKTSLIRKFVDEKFEIDYIPTVGVSISKETVEIDEGQINLMLWDMAGQPQFHALHKVYFNGADGVVLGFDLTRQHTFTNTKNWHKELVKNGLTSLPIILIGNKCDLSEERVIKKAHIGHMQEELSIQHYIETSALNGTNVKEMFRLIAKLIFENKNTPKL